ncbi:deoxyribose-phosphate aldolase [Mordavella massiliensis]|uniref:Deoxyribose-phosphate aldolase n=1 Tax=Mordavella massiliensis TaxID=1871024 RepID=A0A938XAZ7_9CLOT|nr:deoxyribose-phosphate aldolase [Mordavella massiliensis]MBM6947353.1 deoxyribose-phosphate aldolase [Mordavella massiliensis]
MDKREILRHVDHTLLSQDASWEDIRQILDDGIRFGTASVCIPPSYVRQAADYAAGRIPICTVIGFPNGYSTTAVKAFEAADAVENGASEIDMVINVGWLKDGKYDALTEEIRKVNEACRGRILKVIIETCLLTEEEKTAMCRIVTEAGAGYIKTSTGFAAEGATFEDVELMRACVGEHVKVKAAGGIRSFEDAEKFLALGADRLGTSRLVKLMKQEETSV